MFSDNKTLTGNYTDVCPYAAALHNFNNKYAGCHNITLSVYSNSRNDIFMKYAYTDIYDGNGNRLMDLYTVGEYTAENTAREKYPDDYEHVFIFSINTYRVKYDITHIFKVDTLNCEIIRHPENRQRNAIRVSGLFCNNEETIFINI